MSAVSLLLSRGAIPKIDQAGQLALDLSNVPHDQRPEVVALARQHKTAILDELTGGPTGSPAPSSDPWECPTGRHFEFWTSDYGLRICTICHPQPGKGGAAWRQ